MQDTNTKDLTDEELAEITRRHLACSHCEGFLPRLVQALQAAREVARNVQHMHRLATEHQEAAEERAAVAERAVVELRGVVERYARNVTHGPACERWRVLGDPMGGGSLGPEGVKTWGTPWRCFCGREQLETALTSTAALAPSRPGEGRRA